MGYETNMGLIMSVFGIAVAIVSVGGSVWLAVRFGQGGNRLYKADKEQLVGAAANEKVWYGGVFYYNPDDPALLAEKRFGLGMTLNFANKKSWLIIGLIVALLLFGALLSFVATAHGAM